MARISDVKILSGIRRCMLPHACVLIIESVVPQTPGPHLSKELDIAMMALPGGKERTQEEYADLAAKCGLWKTTQSRTHPQPDPLRDRQTGRSGAARQFLELERPYSESGLLLGTSAFTATVGRGVLPTRHEGERIPFLLRDPIQDRRNRQHVLPHPEHIDSDELVREDEKTTSDFIFAAKVPQVVTHA
jgi:hypothetical protein